MSAFLDDLAAIIRASSGSSPSEALRAQVFAALDRSGMPDESYVPEYFLEGMRKLAAQQVTEWKDVADGELGLSWVLRDLVPFLPGAVFREEPGRDELVVPALGLMLAIATSKTKDRWAVLAADAASAAVRAAAHAAPADELRSFQTLSPSAEQLEQWARDPALRLIREDEIIALFNSEQHFAQLVRLALDPATVKRPEILTALDEIVTLGLWREGAAGLRRIDEALAQLPGDRSELPAEVRTWAAALQRLRAYALDHGAVSLDAPRELATQLLKGRRRPGATIVSSTLAPWWQFAATSDGAPPREYLYVHPETGALRFSAAPLTAAQLAELGDLEHRLVPPA